MTIHKWARWFSCRGLACSLVRGLLLSLAITAICGCHEAKLDATEVTRRELTNLANFYARYQGRHRGQLPADEAELREFIQQEGPGVLASMGVDSVDDLFVSARDNQPYVLTYGKVATKTPNAQTMLGHEQQGRDGAHLVVYEGGVVEELTTDQLTKLRPRR